MQKELVRFLALIVLVASTPSLNGQSTKRRFTVADDIGMSHFGDPYLGTIDPITFSPDQQYFAVDTERGLLESDSSESTLRIFRIKQIQEFLSKKVGQAPPLPIWTLRRATYKDGAVISHLRWLANGTGFGFLLRTSSGRHRLFLADLKTRMTTPLTPESQDVTAFDIRDGRHLVYAVLSADILRHATEESRAPAVVGTGRSLLDLLFTADRYPSLMSRWHDCSDLWVLSDRRRFRISVGSMPVHLYWEGLQSFHLSPDGNSLATILPVSSVPDLWARLYRPPYPASPYHIRAGSQDLTAFEGYQYVSEFVQIELRSGKMRRLANAPTGHTSAWWHMLNSSWAHDGKKIVLSNTFLPPDDNRQADYGGRPCVAVVDLQAGSARCLEELKGTTIDGYEEGYEEFEDAHFVDNSGIRVNVAFRGLDGSHRNTTYQKGQDYSWTVLSSTQGSASRERPPLVSIRQSFDQPPVLVATGERTGRSRTLLDPNPQLAAIDMGKASIFKWKDRDSREWKAALYEPSDAVPGKQYPLVVQTHGFPEADFEPSGIYPTALAARELAAAGIVVLQMPSCGARMTPEEAACNLRLYQSGLEKLTAEGRIDPNRMGIVGFSRTCYHVIAAITSDTLHFRAASITDGINIGYLEYLANVDTFHDGLTREAEAIIGTAPFGNGLQKWVTDSPEFNMHKVSIPLLVVANGRPSLLGVWEPYAALRLQHKPVELVVLRGGTHVLTNPRERMVSQGGTVDWFRFWLQEYEDPNPAKAVQYERWRAMRDQMPQPAGK